MNKEETKIIFLLKLVGIALLMGSFFNLPYGYYSFLRIFITGTAIYSAYNYFKAKENIWMWILGFIATLFNPIIPIYLKKQTWLVIDVSTALVFFISILMLKEYRSLEK